MKDILDKIVEQKKIEVQNLKISISEVEKNNKNVYEIISKNKPFFISEFKRKSPSEGDIGLEVNLKEQVSKYLQAGTHAISVLTDSLFFGGKLKDLEETIKLVKDTNVLVLQKDFIIDEQQILQARKHQADLILLIARILKPERLIELKKYAENLGMGVLLELHEAEEFEDLKHEYFPLIGINNRDLNTFQLFLNRFNVVAELLPKTEFLIAESGIQSPIDLAISKSKATGFLVGTSLMKKLKHQTLNEFYNYEKKYFFKACGLRNFDELLSINSDLIGINFSPISKRKITDEALTKYQFSEKFVGVFKENSYEEIVQLIEKYKLTYVQIYANELTFEELMKIKCKKIFAFNPNLETEYNQAIQVSKYVDFFILDGSIPGSGKEILLDKAQNFPYPFLLAGGMNSSNYTKIYDLKNCFGIDAASGVEENGIFSIKKINELATLLN